MSARLDAASAPPLAGPAGVLAPAGVPAPPRGRPRLAGKFLEVDGRKLYPRGATYGAFEPDAGGREYHDLAVVDRDFELMAEQGFNAVRIPHTMPPVGLLDAA